MNAEEFARKAHSGQKRRFSGKDYVEHPLAVMRLLEAAGVADKDILDAALLHDVVEDTKYTIEDILSITNERTASIVQELTLDNPKEEKDIWLKSFHNKSLEALLIKICDRICNILDFLHAASEFKVAAEKPLKYYMKTQPIVEAFLDRECEIKKKFGGTYNIISKFYCHVIDMVENYRQELIGIESSIQRGLRGFEDLVDEDFFKMNEKPNWSV